MIPNKDANNFPQAAKPEAVYGIKKTIINLLSEGYNMNNVASTDIVDNEKVSLYSITKKIMDLVLSFIGLILLIPVFLILAILVKLDSKGPVFYAHTRKGKNRREIKIYPSLFLTSYATSPLYSAVCLDKIVFQAYHQLCFWSMKSLQLFLL